MKLSQAELDIMLVLWECEEPIRPSALLKKMEETHDWSISTLQTLLARLEQKELVRTECRKRFRYCSPMLSKDAYFAMEAQSLFHRLESVSAVPLMVGLINSDRMTEAELTEIEELLRDAKKRLSNRGVGN